MHAGVLGARISEEAFQILLDLLESNFAALNIPKDSSTNPEENRSLIISKKNSSPRGVTSSLRFQENFNIRVSHLIQNPSGEEELRGVYEIIFPIYRNPRITSQRIIMHRGKSLEDSHEPMEVEEISYTDIDEDNDLERFVAMKIKKEPTEIDSSEFLRSKVIIRESKLKIPEGKITRELELENKNTDDKKIPELIILDDAEPRNINTKTPMVDEADIQKMKSKLRPLVKKEVISSTNEETSYFFYFWQMIFFILFPIAVLIACVSIAREEFDSEICAHRFDATNAIKDLENRIFGQTRGIEELSHNLGLKSNGTKILAIIGGTGVGKSYAAHIVSENFPIKRNVFQYVPPLESRRRFASGAISICGCNLIILENLNTRDIPKMVKFVEYIAGKIDNINYCVLILNIINVQETDDNLHHRVNLTKSQIYIENIYREKNLAVKIIQFDNLDDQAITRCILDAANERNLSLSKNEIDDIRISLKISDSGCKGARAKVQLLNKKILDTD